MRTYILTEREKKIINKYLQKNEKHEGFRDLVYLLKNLADNSTIQSDYILLEKFSMKLMEDKIISEDEAYVALSSFET